MNTLISAIGITALSLSLGWQVQASAEAISTNDDAIVVDETADSELMVDFVYDDASGYVEEDEGASEANSEEEVVDPYMGNYDESEGDTGECTEDCNEDDGYTGYDD
jgi:hypothetical protein